MTDQPSSLPDYSTGFSDVLLATVRRYRAATNAAYLLPHLEPGMKMIDVGCGPGSISVGLAEAVAPGELHGVDADGANIEISKSIAVDSGQSNAIFRVGDPLELPYDDDAFDVAHCHYGLTYVPDAQAALAEIRRVLKPGGILGWREMITGSCIMHPDFGVLQRAWDLFEDILTTDDAHPQMGKEVKSRLVGAGFENIRMSASYDIYDTPEDVKFIYDVAHQWLLTPEVMDTAIIYGAATQELCDSIRDAYDKWKAHPGAFCALAWGEVVATSP